MCPLFAIHAAKIYFFPRGESDIHVITYLPPPRSPRAPWWPRLIAPSSRGRPNVMAKIKRSSLKVWWMQNQTTTRQTLWDAPSNFMEWTADCTLRLYASPVVTRHPLAISNKLNHISSCRNPFDTLIFLLGPMHPPFHENGVVIAPLRPPSHLEMNIAC